MSEESRDVQHPEDEAQKEKGILIVFRFILVPLIVVGIVVFIVVLFGQIALKEKSVADYLYDIRTGSQSERWQAAYHLSNLLANSKRDYASEARKQLPEMILIFRKSKGSDSEIRQYLALALGRLQDPRAVPALQESINDDDSKTVIWSIWALGSIGDKGSTPLIIEKLESQDSGIRIMSAYVLGALADTRAVAPLQGHLDDDSAEVTWNAAIALSRMKDSAGSQILLKLMRRDYLAGMPNLSEEKKEDLMINAIKAATNLNDGELTAQIKAVSTSDPNPRVRNTALKALQ